VDGGPLHSAGMRRQGSFAAFESSTRALDELHIGGYARTRGTHENSVLAPASQTRPLPTLGGGCGRLSKYTARILGHAVRRQSTPLSGSWVSGSWLSSQGIVPQDPIDGRQVAWIPSADPQPEARLAARRRHAQRIGCPRYACTAWRCARVQGQLQGCCIFRLNAKSKQSPAA
jgi:hypothetical protein